MKTLFGKTFDIMQRALELRSKRNALLASNIANVDTPGYKARDLDFRKLMKGYMKDLEVEARAQKGHGIESAPVIALDQKEPAELLPSATNPRHLTRLPETEPRGLMVSSERGVPNNVDLDEQMSRLSENNLQYQAAIQMLVKKFEMLREAVTEGGRQ